MCVCVQNTLTKNVKGEISSRACSRWDQIKQRGGLFVLLKIRMRRGSVKIRARWEEIKEKETRQKALREELMVFIQLKRSFQA